MHHEHTPPQAVLRAPRAIRAETQCRQRDPELRKKSESSRRLRDGARTRAARNCTGCPPQCDRVFLRSRISYAVYPPMSPARPIKLAHHLALAAAANASSHRMDIISCASRAVRASARRRQRQPTSARSHAAASGTSACIRDFARSHRRRCQHTTLGSESTTLQRRTRYSQGLLAAYETPSSTCAH